MLGAYSDVVLARNFSGRYEEGCEEARYPDGTKALLLPYPDLLPGQGKIVEGMGRKWSFTKSRKTKANVDSSSSDNDHVEDEEWNTDLDSSAPSKKTKSIVGFNKEVEPRARVQPLADILIGPTPTRVEKVAIKKKVKFVAQPAKLGDRVDGVPKHTISPWKPAEGSEGAQQVVRKTRGWKGSDLKGGLQTKKRRLEAELSPRKGDVGDQRLLVWTTPPSVACTEVITKDNLLPSASADMLQVLKRSAWTTTSGKQLKLPPKKNYPVRL